MEFTLLMMAFTSPTPFSFTAGFMCMSGAQTKRTEGIGMHNHKPGKTKIGKCIYCRVGPTNDDSLQDEHVVPFAIDGSDVLEKASCRICARKTSAVESRALGQDLKGIRTVLGFRTRHRRKRSSTLPIEVLRNTGEVEEVDVPLNEYPRILAFPVFPPPAYLSKASYQDGIEVVGIQVIQGNQEFASVADKYDAQEMAVYVSKYPKDWARMLAKIAYGFAVHSQGLDHLSVDDTYVLNSILGVADDVGMWVG